MVRLGTTEGPHKHPARGPFLRFPYFHPSPPPLVAKMECMQDLEGAASDFDQALRLQPDNKYALQNREIVREALNTDPSRT